MADSKIIIKIEEELGISIDLVKKFDWHTKSYVTNSEGRVVGLKLNGMNLRKIPMSISELVELEWLDLSGNKISSVPISIKALTNLRFLDLSGNIINSFPSQIFPPTLEVHIKDNPLKSFPIEIANQGIDAIKNYITQIEEQGKKYLFEAKLLILGASGSGKTTFARKLKNFNASMPIDSETTKRIIINEWLFKIDNSEFSFLEDDENSQDFFQLNLWDFGGQEIYHATHQFFISHRSLYVLIADSREQQTDFNFWLNTVEQLGGESPLIIVVNEKHDHSWKIDKIGLRGRFSDLLKDVVEIDLSKRGDDLNNLRKTIQNYSKQLPHIGHPLPAGWTSIRSRLKILKKNFISFESFLQICDEEGLGLIEHVLTLSQYFHDIGVFLHFQDDEILRNKIFLNPNWTTQTIYKILNDPIVKVNKGRFSEKDVNNIWSSFGKDLPKLELLQLLKRFSLVYQIKNKKDYFVPEHLPDAKPYGDGENAHLKGKSLILRYQFDRYMPKGLMSKLIVAIHRYIYDQELVWKRGVVLNRKGAFAEIIETYGNQNEFRITIFGDGREKFLEIILEEFDQILEFYPKLSFEKLIPCNCKECKLKLIEKEKYFFKFSSIERRQNKGIKKIQCDFSYKELSIEYLLSGISTKDSELFELIHEFIGKNEIVTAINYLEKWANEKENIDLKNRCTLHRRRLKNIENDHLAGKLALEEYRKSKTVISSSILNELKLNN